MEALKFLTLKDIMRIVNCSKYEASKLRNDIAQEYQLNKKRVTYEHLKKYLKL